MVLNLGLFDNRIQPHTSSENPPKVSESDAKDQESRIQSVVTRVNSEESQNEDESSSTKYIPRLFDVWALGMTTVLGGTYYGWNEGLKAGFGSYLVGQVLMGISYVVLVCALAEIVSTTSFSGGAYGMARVMLGFYPGFMMAAFEVTEYLTYPAASFSFISGFICTEMGLNNSFEPLIILACYLFSAIFLLTDNRLFWSLNALLGLFSVAGILFYCFGSLPYTNFIENASLHLHPNSSDPRNWFHGGIRSFLVLLPFTTWGFGGIESAALVTDLISNPRKNLSWGITYAGITLFVLMIFTLFVAVSLPPGMKDTKMWKNQFFMDYGYEKMGFTAQNSQWVLLIPQFAMAFGFLLPAAKLFEAMACSKLLPSFLHAENTRNVTIYTLILSFVLSMCAIYIPSFDITNIPILFAMITYWSDLFAYYKLNSDFSTMDRLYHSPFGLVGTIFAGIIFLLCIIALIAFQSTFFILYFLIGFTMVLTLYYFFYAKSRQIFSEEEQKTLLSLHVMTLNKNKRRKTRSAGLFFFKSKSKSAPASVSKRSKSAALN